MLRDAILRLASAADTAAVLALTQAAFQQNHAETGLYGYVYSETPAEFQANLHTSDWVPLVLEDAGVIVAAVRINWSYPNSINLGRLAVLPERQGQGIGLLLLEAIERLAQAWGRTYVTLGVLEASPRNAQWYARLGYTPFTRKEMSSAPGNFYALLRKPVPARPASDTVHTYTRIASDYAARHHSPRSWTLDTLEGFKAALPAPARVLDLGCGPGRDSLLLQQHGYTVASLDATWAMLQQFALPTRLLGDARCLPFGAATMDGVWASASLLHIPRLELFGALLEIRRVLRGNGIFQLSLKIGHDERTVEDGRHFAYYQPPDVLRMLESSGFVPLNHWVRPDERPGWQDWVTIIARRTPDQEAHHAEADATEHADA